MGLVGLSSVAGCNSAPLEKLYAYLTPPEEITPGIAAYYATVCRACPAGCGIMVKTREARPIKLEGNPDHPVNRGALCVRGQAFIQSLYSRHRVRKPMLRKNGALSDVSWDEARAAVAAKMKTAQSVALLTGLESGSFEDLAEDFLSRYPKALHLQYEPVGFAAVTEATRLLTGSRVVPRYHIDRAAYVLSLGADVLDAFMSPVEYAGQWSRAHGVEPGKPRAMTLEYAGPRLNLTANAADRHHLLPADRVAPLALALLHDVYAAKKASLSPETAGVIGAVITKLGPRPTIDDMPDEALQRIADKLIATKNSLVLYGGAEVTDANATAGHTAAYLLNYLTGATGVTMTLDESYMYAKLAPDAKVAGLLAGAAKGEYDILFTCGTNPAYTMPGASGAATALEKAPFVVALAYEHNETTRLADVVLPVHHPLESWGDYEVSSDTIGIMQPVRAPLYATQLAGDALIGLAAAAGKPLNLPVYKDYVVQHWSKISGFAPMAAAETAATGDPGNVPAAAGGVPAGYKPPSWEETLIRGGLFAGDSQPLNAPALSPDISPDAVPAMNIKNNTGLTLIAPVSVSLYDGRGASQDWLLEIPDSLNETAWEIPVEIPAKLAASRGISNGDIVTLSSAANTIDVTAIVNGQLAPDTVALRMGGGRRFRHAPDLRSESVMQLITGETDRASGQFSYVQPHIKLTRKAKGPLTSVMGSPYSEGRYLCLAMNQADLKNDRYPFMTRHGEHAPEPWEESLKHRLPMPQDELENRHPHDNITELQAHPEHRWGMTVDLDKCIGCASCVSACYAENNIPVVGRREIARGRELSWIRIERHIFPDEGGRTRFLPVMCQQCDNAPCETVCPVFASSHTPDGLNAQIYNRCIGTRYCSNNCPYKVRRFNYFDYDREKPANQQLNPDVTVRSRGVMEKCTFCIQRIRDVTNRAKAEKRPVTDGEITPACVQTCPTKALTFGDYKLKDAHMSTLARDKRGYRLLDYITNTRPGVVYLRKVYSEPEEV